MNRDVPSTDHDPRTFRNFAPLPAVLLFLRLERSLRPLEMDLALHLPHGSYRSYEMGLTAPALGTLDRILAFFHLGLRALDEKLWQDGPSDMAAGRNARGRERALASA